ncbi:hypothetical protein AVEN_265055-1, partial [Araneus ventricosus]
ENGLSAPIAFPYVVPKDLKLLLPALHIVFRLILPPEKLGDVTFPHVIEWKSIPISGLIRHFPHTQAQNYAL